MAQPKILIIDDSLSIRRTVAAALAARGYEVIEAVDGEDGRLKIAEHADLAAVVCDVNMPRLDGLSMMERVLADPVSSKLPFLMLTTEGEPAMVQRARTAGARGWIVKPFHPDLLVAAVRRVATG